MKPTNLTSLDMARAANVPRMSKPGPLSGICQGGPRDKMMLATLAGRRTPMDGGAYVYRAAANGHHLGTWVWLADSTKGD